MNIAGILLLKCLKEIVDLLDKVNIYPFHIYFNLSKHLVAKSCFVGNSFLVSLVLALKILIVEISCNKKLNLNRIISRVEDLDILRGGISNLNVIKIKLRWINGELWLFKSGFHRDNDLLVHCSFNFKSGVDENFALSLNLCPKLLSFSPA